jgi:hypothetical protein
MLQWRSGGGLQPWAWVGLVEKVSIKKYVHTKLYFLYVNLYVNSKYNNTNQKKIIYFFKLFFFKLYI